jgi:acetyl/propionyl-CoA carboxylase alpha subunit
MKRTNLNEGGRSYEDDESAKRLRAMEASTRLTVENEARRQLLLRLQQEQTATNAYSHAASQAAAAFEHERNRAIAIAAYANRNAVLESARNQLALVAAQQKQKTEGDLYRQLQQEQQKQVAAAASMAGLLQRFQVGGGSSIPNPYASAIQGTRFNTILVDQTYYRDPDFVPFPPLIQAHTEMISLICTRIR